MKQIFKIIFCLFLALSFNFADEIKDDNSTPQYQILTKQVDDLYDAIMSDDYDKVKTMLDINTKFLNLDRFLSLSIQKISEQRKLSDESKKIFELILEKGANPNAYVESEDDSIVFSYPMVIIRLDLPNSDTIYLLEILKKYGLNLNNPSELLNGKPSEYLLTTVNLLAEINKSDYFEIFDYLAKHRVKPDKALSFIVFLDLGRKTNELFREKKFDELREYIKSSEYLNLRDKYKKYFISAFSNYKIDDFKFDEILNIVIYFIVSKDDEILSLLRQNGYFDNKKLQEKIEIFKQENNFN